MADLDEAYRRQLAAQQDFVDREQSQTDAINTLRARVAELDGALRGLVSGLDDGESGDPALTVKQFRERQDIARKALSSPGTGEYRAVKLELLERAATVIEDYVSDEVALSTGNDIVNKTSAELRSIVEGK